MRRYIDIVESVSGNTLPATPTNVANAKRFLLAKWRERNAERGEAESNDLSRGCKFAALFARAIFGGKIEANHFHTWVNLNGRILDLTEDADDVQQMKKGVIPDYAKSYAATGGVELPERFYTPDPIFMMSDDFRHSLRSNMPRVKRWVMEFRETN